MKLDPIDRAFLVFAVAAAIVATAITAQFAADWFR